MYKIEGSTILVTGGAGFIGSHLCDALLGRGAHVVCMDNLSTGKTENLEHALSSEHFVFIEGDVNDKAFLQPIFEKYSFDYVFHYAAVLGVQRVIEQPLLVLDDIAGTRAIMELACEYGIKKVVFSSSSEAYGHMAELPLKEDTGKELSHQTHSTSLYSLVKITSEKILEVYNYNYKIPTCSLRFFNVFGPRQESSSYGFVIGIFIKQILEGKSPVIFGDGYQTRDFIYIDDNINIALRALESEKADGHIVNVGMGRQTTIRDLAERLIDISGKDLKPIFQPAREYEIRYRSPDVTKMQQLLETSIEDNFNENLAKTYEWYQSQQA
ncbi:MAG: hypothetical protein COV59_03775 [Candidatus Magasanikbacteria bacterium CG11_big_fil_rev_8_21_14_0_20_39_34]|uniref:NAD-dependent epimerase/dehydratase domain-containing protein n=1 Tax=Candidatus Magasanikbacteria bacterium CG11_big_fil_rev_8_21_14_0_20_39_34 TaxID=1974653 RepID=A0A2H0N6P0_9BACT|nr:MAG: hypothetical protein COV59_03775 [Candidatus Magasanikbacteria bacterium CG11_big_fil_rev_8_21_14_0_20_39_34]